MFNTKIITNGRTGLTRWHCAYTPNGWKSEPIMGQGETKEQAEHMAQSWYDNQIVSPKPFHL